MNTGLRLYKKEKLCSATAIDLLFSRGSGAFSTLAYPIRAVWRHNPRRSSDAPVAFVIVVPKRRLRHAVDRVLMRRRIREAYRLSRHILAPLTPGTRIDVAFVYAADKLRPYSRVLDAMHAVLARIAQANSPASPTPPQDLAREADLCNQ